MKRERRGEIWIGRDPQWSSHPTGQPSKFKAYYWGHCPNYSGRLTVTANLGHQLSRKPGPEFDHLLGKEILPNIQSKSPLKDEALNYSQNFFMGCYSMPNAQYCLLTGNQREHTELNTHSNTGTKANIGIKSMVSQTGLKLGLYCFSFTI